MERRTYNSFRSIGELDTMKKSQKIQLRISEAREKANALLSKESLTDDERTALAGHTAEMTAAEVEMRSAIVVESAEEEAAKKDAGPVIEDAEVRARLELRSKCLVTNYILAAIRGRALTGPEAELHQECKLDDGMIPIELWEKAPAEAETRAVTPAPTTGVAAGGGGVNLDTIQPAVYAPSVAGRQGVDMPMVMSGTYATGTQTTSINVDAVARGADVPQDAGAITVQSTTPHRVGADMGWAVEDIAQVGQANFEAITRGNISLALSDEIDNQLLNGTGSGNDLTGMFQRLTDPSDPVAGLETWERFLAIQSGAIDGLWATMLSHVSLLVGAETYRLACAVFRGVDGPKSAASYMTEMGAPGAAFWTNKRMPDPVSDVQAGIVCRKGRTMDPSPMRLAVAPIWGGGNGGYVGIDDVYSGRRAGERYFTVYALIGDVILVQPDAFAQVAFRVSL